jgi:hypothetical protein
MSWSTPIDLYCERLDPSLWAEPINALTNAAFLVAAIVAFAEWRRAGGRDWPALALIFVTAVIAFGSFAFHTLATRGAVLLDIIPIAVFVYGYLFLALRRFLRLPLAQALAILIPFIVVSLVIDRQVPRAILNGSISYLPALAGIIAIGWLTRAQTKLIAIAAGVFVVSLTLRTIDNAACGAFPLGTHFVWHVMNAVVLYLLLRAAIRNAPQG